MAFDEKYSSIILKRVSESQNPSKQVELISDDDQRIPIHRVILSAASKYFADKFGLKSRSRICKDFPLRGADDETLRMIVNYCYTGHIELTGENVQTFLTIASKYQLDLLEEQCCSFYAETLSVTNSVETLMFAEDFNYADLRQAALNLICENFKSVPTAEVQKLDHQLFQEILESDKITSSEELIFDRLVKWSEHGEREPFVPNLLKLIRLQHIKIEVLRDTVEAFYERCDSTKLLLAEYRRRASDNHFDSGFRRHLSLFCLFTQYEEVNGAEYAVIKVGRFETETRNLKEIADFALRKRTDFTVVLNQNKIYVFGGRLNRVPSNLVSSFDLNSGLEEILPNMNISRKNCTSILFEECIYVCGGWNDYSGSLSSCERFDIKLKTWTEIKSMSVARTDAPAVVMNRCIYIAGGWGDDGETSTFESYDPVKNEWMKLAPMNISRSDFALIQSNGFIYALGWKDTIEKYDPSKNQWMKISNLDGSRSITSGINLNDEMYVLKSNGDFRRIDESDNCLFLPWVVETEYISDFMGCHFLTLN